MTRRGFTPSAAVPRGFTPSAAVSRGFTLVELLAASALFAVLALLLFQMVGSATSVWTSGERNREAADRAQAVLDLAATDLRHLWPGARGAGEQEARLLCTWRESDPDGDGTPELRVAALRFTRVLHESRSLPWLRAAGSVPGGERASALLVAEDPAELLPTGGLGESLYTLAVVPGQSVPTLFRRVRSRAGGEGSLVSDDLLDRREKLLDEAVALADGVLHFGAHFEAAGADNPLEVWDSTRALLDAEDDGFPWAVGAGSLWDGRDDVFPELVTLELVLDDGVVAGRLAEALTDRATGLAVSSGDLSGDVTAVLVDREWLAVVRREGARLTVERGHRGTLPAPHAAGALVRVGQTFRRAVRLPASRADFNR